MDDSASFSMGPPPVPDTGADISFDSPAEKQLKLVTPLGDMLPPEFRGKDVREFFPDFRVGEVRLNVIISHIPITQSGRGVTDLIDWLTY